jgi:O-acetyl-ADP-ribose deacetylase (regulator of RNase III)
MDFKLVLVDPKEHLIEEWKHYFSVYPEVSYHHGRFEEIEEYDCLINAGNSFGLMDGGVDLAISEFFGPELQEDVQDLILLEYAGEQPVGTSFLVSTANPDHPYMAHTPTMRAPTIIRGTENVYNAFRAALVAIDQHWGSLAYGEDEDSWAEINTILCMGMGTSCGGLEVEEAARQMFLAYRSFRNPPKKINWEYAKRIHREVAVDHRGHCLDILK